MSARVDYALRALTMLANEFPALVKSHRLATELDIPPRYLDATLRELGRAHLTESHRGANGGTRLARPPDQISVADVIVALDGALLDLRSVPPSPTTSNPDLASFWRAFQRTLEQMLDTVTVRDIAVGPQPAKPGRSKASISASERDTHFRAPSRRDSWR